ncbi:glutaredoxin family protein [Candidatus Nitrospira neomarina]|uniref:NrdH-redoxin n=1 Tax=Candidatus Nitrospira neomarina TaxID=3020899 RepID=A0AA96JWP9_9BACT|nr:NrdH-redoxin [Candidatus Nitrospira neomarina]WNM62280.1 NrdH-redoxin [Candidatus Nitrospira neomarina]
MNLRKRKNLLSLSHTSQKPTGQQCAWYLKKRGWPPVLLCVAFVLVAVLGLSGKPAVVPEQAESDLEVFVRQGCLHCEKAKSYLTRLKQQYPRLTVTLRDIGEDPQAFLRLKTLAAKFGLSQLGVPAFYARGVLLIGFESAETTGKQLEELLGRPPPEAGTSSDDACPVEPDRPCPPVSTQNNVGGKSIQVPFLGDRTLPELGLPLFTVFLGLLDGFNPCAMWVLLFLLALLANLRDRRKMFLLAGTFVLVSGMVYFAFMAAWLNIFLLIGYVRIIQIMMGGLAVGIGLVNVKEFVAFGQGLSLAIPDSAKPGLYARVRKILAAEHMSQAMIGILVLAILVNMIEFVCTAGFPALFTHVLSQQGLTTLEYFGYIGLYNLAYVADDAVLVTIAVVTLSHRKLQEREGRWLKLISGLVMLNLGLLLLFAPTQLF